VGHADLTLRLAPAEKRRVRRRLVHEGRPVSGALVRLVDVSFGVEREPLASVRTDGDGRVEFETVAHRDYALESSVGRLRAFDVVRGSGFDDGDLDLLGPLAVSGTVTRGGRPEAGATVEMRRDAPREILTTRTDDLGRYRFEEVRRPRHRMEVVVLVRGPGGASRWARAHVTHAQTDDVIVPAIDLAPFRLRGHVRDVEGRPLARAVVQNANPWGVATTDGEGAFEIPGAAGGCRLAASVPGYVTHEVEVWAVEDTSACDFVLRRGGSLQGRVSDEEGRAADATVTILGKSPGRPKAWVRNGSWSVDGLVGTAFGVRIEMPGCEPVELTGLPPDSVAPPVVLRRTPPGRASSR
jgi:hypothetical protein